MPGHATPSYLEQEIREQAEVLGSREGPGWRSAEQAAALLRRSDVDYLMIVARGTSDNAARYAQYLLGVEARLPVGLAAPWLFGGASPPLLSRGAVLAISQSGGSPDIASVVEAAAEQGRPTVVVTNHPESRLADRADVVVEMLAGQERSVAATKTYLASLHAMAQIAECLSPDADRRKWFGALPGLVESMVASQLGERGRFDRLARCGVITAVGRGLEMATAYETALKLRELGGVVAEAFSLPDLIHGPIAGLSKAGALWLIGTSGRDQPDRRDLEVIGASSGLTVAVTDRADLLRAADIGVLVPQVPEWLAPLLAVIPGQAAALRLGELAGVDVDRPHGLSKVTLTT